MRPIHTALLLVATFPATGVSQTPPAPAPAPTPARPPVAAPAYRGFTPGISYREFLERARPLADSDMVRCQTSPHTAQVMECGVVIRGPNDAARFYLSAHFIEGNADVVAFYDSAGFGDKRGVPLVDRTKKELTRLFGRPHPIGKSGWEWRYGRRAVRFNWRGRGTARWVSITLMDKDVMDRIARYAKTAKSRKS
jgi:GNAT superfamily N-acetyltransferase